VSASSRVAALVPATGLEPYVDACVASLAAAGIEDVRVVAWRAPETQASRYQAAAPGSYARAMNVALQEVRAETILVAVPVVRLRSGVVAAYLARLGSSGAGVVYGDHDVVVPGAPRVPRTSFAAAEDLSEFSGFGYLRAVRRAALVAAGGWDERFLLAEDYDLRLRLGEVTTFARAEDVRHDVVLPADEPARAAVRAALTRYFTAESAGPAGFGYLFLDGALEREIGLAFRSCLERRGARLDGAPESFVCPHRDARPTVSVVIPTFDRARMLERAIETVRDGTFADFEVLVVDNGSRDDTVARVERLRRTDRRIALLHNPGRSIASALNLGVRAARGKYVAQLDSDDEYLPATLATQVAHLEANPDWALAVSYYDVIDEEGRMLPQYGIVRHLEYDRDTILRTGGAGAVRTWHRCVLETLGGFDEGALASYGEDYDLVLRASERFAVGRVHEVLYRVRIHATNTDKQLDSRTRATSKAEARRRALARRQAAHRRARAADGDRR
jgi:GT2 family glycosyltransferase